MKKVSAFFSLLAVAFGTIPGLTILMTNLGVPPGTSKALFAATIESTGIMTLLLLWINSDRIKMKPIFQITKYAIVGGISFFFFLLAYIFCFDSQIVEVPNSLPLLFPLFPQGELQKGLSEFGSKFSLIQEWGRDDVFKVIQSSSKQQLNITILIFLILYQLIFVSLTFSFGLLGIKVNQVLPQRKD